MRVKERVMGEKMGPGEDGPVSHRIPSGKIQEGKDCPFNSNVKCVPTYLTKQDDKLDFPRVPGDASVTGVTEGQAWRQMLGHPMYPNLPMYPNPQKMPGRERKGRTEDNP